jgi:hypothetical protein
MLVTLAGMVIDVSFVAFLKAPAWISVTPEGSETEVNAVA